MEEQNLNPQIPSTDAQDSKPKSPSPQRQSPEKMVVEEPPKSPNGKLSAEATDVQAGANPKESSGKVQGGKAVPEQANAEPKPQSAQKSGQNVENKSVEKEQSQANQSEPQAAAQGMAVEAAANVVAVPKENKGPRISFYGSCECDQFFAGEDRYIIKRPFELTNHFTQIDRTVYSVVCGGLHTLILLTNGEVYSLGNNDDGALGRAGEENTPAKVDLPVPIDMISAGDSHSIACNSANSMIFQWGVYRNVLRGNISKATTPHRIGEKEIGKKKIKKILSGANHTLVLAEEKVYVWGDPEAGILGRIPTEKRMFTQGLNIEGLGFRQVENIFTGQYHSFLTQRKKRKTASGEETYSVLLAWGLNNFGQLGIGSFENTHIPTEIEEFEGVEIKDIRGGEHHTILLTAEGQLYGFGKNDEGQIGAGAANLKAKWEEERRVAAAAAAAAAEAEAAKKKEEEKEKEKMVDEADEKKEKKDEVKEEKEEVFNTERVKDPTKLSLNNVEKIFVGSHYNYAIDRDNKVYSWGMGDNYLLGNREEETVEEPTEIGEDFFKGKAILFGLGAQHVVTLVVNDVTVKLELEEDVTKVVEKQKKSAAKSKKSESKDDEEEKKDVEEKKEAKKGRGKSKAKEDKIEEEKEEKKPARAARGKGKAKEEKVEEEEEEDEEEEEEEEKKPARGRSKPAAKKGKSVEKKPTKAAAAKSKSKSKAPKAAAKDKKETKATAAASDRKGRKRRPEEKDDGKELKKVKKTATSRSASRSASQAAGKGAKAVSKSAKKTVQTKRR